MDEPLKQPHGIGWYAAWTVIALAVYVASSGPACWVQARVGGYEIFATVYAPIIAIIDHGPKVIGKFLGWWIDLGMPDAPPIFIGRLVRSIANAPAPAPHC